MVSRLRLVLTELREYRSERTGSTYFAGYLGKARVVMLRDERAEITGKEVARWNLLVEEPEPRDGRRDRAGRAQGGRGWPRTSDGPPEGRVGRPGVRQGHSARQRDRRRGEGAAAERRAGDLLRERGVDPASDLSRDEIPF